MMNSKRNEKTERYIRPVMSEERYKPDPFERRMDKLLQSRDLMLDTIHKLMLSNPEKPTGLCGFLDSYEKTCNMIERIENRGARDDKKIIVEFARVPELEFEKDDESVNDPTD